MAPSYDPRRYAHFAGAMGAQSDLSFDSGGDW